MYHKKQILNSCLLLVLLTSLFSLNFLQMAEGRDFILAWPLLGDNGKDWVINNYVDQDAGSGVSDYMGGSKSYNGHDGIDIDVPSFAQMDSNIPVIAAAPGIVTRIVEDTVADRNMSGSSDRANEVWVTHQNGYKVKYLHLKYNSVSVKLNQYVNTGDILGVVGSSGNSTAPHLHMSIYDNDQVIDPFKEGLFANPPAYSTSLSLMDVVFKESSFNGIDELKDPPISQISRVMINSTVGVGLNMANGLSGDRFHIKLINPSGDIHWESTRSFAGTERHTYWVYNVDLSSEAGIWKWEVSVNGSESYARTFEAYDATLPPSVSIITPIDNSHYIEGVTIPILVDASCPAGVAQVDFFANGSFFNTDKTVPYFRQLDGLSVGTHNISVDVLCSNGLKTVKATDVIVDPIGAPLVVNLNTPLDGGSYVSGDAMDAYITTSDDSQVNRVEIWVDETMYAKADSAPWIIDLSDLSPGSHTIQARAIDFSQSVFLSIAAHITVAPSTKPEFILDIPLPGVNGKDWVIHHYYDVSESTGIDYMSGHKTYPGHRAVDFDSASFEQMDTNMPILAAAPGVVVNVVEDIVADRNIYCPRTPGNIVWVKHDNGLTIRYAHLKYNSVPVILNQVIHTGDVLGVIGSSGESCWPHLHMSIFDAEVNGYDPFDLNLWRDPPPYELPISSMDIVYAEGDSLDLIDPPTTDMTSALLNTPVVVGLNLANGRDGDYFRVQLIDPNGEVQFDKTGYSWSGAVHSYYDYSAILTGKAGVWRWNIDINGAESHTHEFKVYEPEIVTLQPIADTYISSNDPSRNFGSKDQIITDGDSNVRVSYLKFDLSGYQIFGATLRLSQRYNGGEFDTVEVRLLSDTEWDESLLTWNNRPFDTGALIGSEVVGVENEWYSFDLGNHLNSESSIITLRVSGAVGNVHKWKSREHADNQPPELIIQTVKRQPDAASPCEIVATNGEVTGFAADGQEVKLPKDVHKSIEQVATQSGRQLSLYTWFGSTTPFAEVQGSLELEPDTQVKKVKCDAISAPDPTSPCEIVATNGEVTGFAADGQEVKLPKDMHKSIDQVATQPGRQLSLYTWFGSTTPFAEVQGSLELEPDTQVKKVKCETL